MQGNSRADENSNRQRATRPVSGRSNNRRRFLQGVGVAGAVGLAGCVGSLPGFGGGGDNESQAGEEDLEGGVEVDEGDADIILRLDSLLTGGDGDPFEAMVEDFNEQSDNVAVEVTRVPWDEYYDQLFTAMTADEAPDIAFSHSSQIVPFLDNLTPLDDYVNYDPYVEQIVDSVEYDGQHYGAPLDTHMAAVYYNKEIYEEAGLDPEEPPTNWEEFAEANDAIVDAGYYAFDYGTGMHICRSWGGWLRSRGHEVIQGEEGNWEPNFNNEGGVEVTQALREAVEREWTPTEDDNSWPSFVEGDFGAVVDGTWAWSRFREGGGEELDFDWGTYDLSLAPGKEEDWTMCDSHNLVVPAADHSEEELEGIGQFFEYMTQERAVDWSAEAGHLAATTEALGSDDLREREAWDYSLHTFQEIADNGELYYWPATQNTDEYSEAIYQSLEAVRFGQQDAQAALDEAEQRCQEVFE
ncbi:extracellular solute-binding protein [Halomontanus rarus]|uniref:extracellular solute-binding protein n=1 Tax=Halomontanus rarus TaxID=3034020 RepID=UPI001A97E0F7